MSRRYVVMALQGGLGNQLFQYASGLGLARSLDAEIFFDPRQVAPGEEWIPDLVGTDYRVASQAQLNRLGVLHRGERARDEFLRLAGMRVVTFARRVRGRTGVRQPLHHDLSQVGVFDERMLHLDLPVYFCDYYQTERWFTNVADHVAAQLRLPAVEPLRPPGAAPEAPTVALSFRRGDYLRFGWQLPMSYYEHALARMVDEVPGATFVVFGDDPVFTGFAINWVERFGPAVSAYSRGAHELVHLALAAACDHALIANSSFAWWGAWLGDRRVGPDADRLVLAPADYPARFGADVVPERWGTIES
ncbi:MAG: alpha-1,2-fucosyltransferase [Acidimicrobiia bacterium]